MNLPLKLLLSIMMVTVTMSKAMAASLIAELDRAETAEGQSVVFTLTASDLEGEPDFALLSSDFEILDRSSSSQINMTNGRMQSLRVWQLGLMPLRTGALTIPALSLAGESSQPLTLKVHTADSQSAFAGTEEFILELSVDKQQPYVQEQVILSAKVFQSRSILEGSLSDPKVDGVILERLGNDRTYSAQLNNRNWQVIERKYAVFPQQSGDLTLGPLRLVATVRQDSRTGRSLFTPTRKITVSSNRVTLNIQPRVEGSGWWLPAESLSLSAEWNQDPEEARVDEPVTRTITLTATGLHSTQLPEIDAPEIENARVYPDQAEIQHQFQDNSVTSYRTEKWAIIPRSPGKMVLPEIRVTWFDTVNQTMQTAVLPEEVIEVKGGEVNEIATPVEQATESLPQPSSAPLQMQAEPSDLQNEFSTQEVDHDKSHSELWFLLAIFAFLGWGSTALAWWLKTLGTSSADSSQTTNLNALTKVVSLKDVEIACKGNNPEQINMALLSWSNRQWAHSTHKPRNLQQLAEKLKSDEIQVIFSKLESCLYSGQSCQVDFSGLIEKLRYAVNQSQRENRAAVKENLLPQL